MVAEILVMDFVSQKREQRDFSRYEVSCMRSRVQVVDNVNDKSWISPPSPFDVAQMLVERFSL